MTGFTIFAIVLTIAYIIYYAAMITIDIAAQKKASQTDEETIDTGNHSEEVDEFATKTVIENPNTGGFEFATPKVQQEKTSNIFEIEEQDESEGTTPMDENTEIATETSDATEQQMPPSINAAENPKQHVNPDDNQDKNEKTENVWESAEDEPSEKEKQQDDEETEGIRTYTYSGEESETDEPESKFDENDAFDPSLRQQNYDVKTVYESSASKEVQSHANTVNTSMEPIHRNSKGMGGIQLREALRKQQANSNIYYRNEQTRY